MSGELNVGKTVIASLEAYCNIFQNELKNLEWAFLSHGRPSTAIVKVRLVTV